MRIGIVAGEASGDILGAGLIAALKKRHPEATFEGIGGPLMQAQGCLSLFPMERLSVMGISEVLGRLRELLAIRRQLFQHFIDNPPDLFIGIDAPDFNLTLERKLKAAGIKSAHYVSPSVWAWRQYRVKKIARSIDLMLTLFPFEADFYREHGLKVAFVGHPLADEIALETDQGSAREALGLKQEGEYLALLPGSRHGELSRLGPLMLQTARLCRQERPTLRFLAPMASEELKQAFLQMIADGEYGDLDLHLVDGRSREVMAAADSVLLASGTATLEAMLLKRPMVVTYIVSGFTYWLAKRLASVTRVSLPNLLAGQDIVPELIQEQARPELLAKALLSYFEQPAQANQAMVTFNELHRQLRRGASERAAEALLELLS